MLNDNGLVPGDQVDDSIKQVEKYLKASFVSDDAKYFKASFVPNDSIYL